MISPVISACVCGSLLCVRSSPAVVGSRRVAACAVCSLAAFHGAAVISPAAAAGHVFLYLVVNRTVLVLDDAAVSSVVTFNLKLLKQPGIFWSPCKDLNLKTRVLKWSDSFPQGWNRSICCTDLDFYTACPICPSPATSMDFNFAHRAKNSRLCK